MTPEVPHPDQMSHTKRHAHSRKAGSTTKIGATRASSEQESSIGTLVNHVKPEEQTAKEKQPRGAKRAVINIQATLKDALTSIPELVKNAVTALVTPDVGI